MSPERGGDGSPLSVLMLNHNVVWRSTFYRAFGFARELAARGHDVTLATISPSRRVTAREHVLDGVTIVETPDLGVGLARTGWDPWDALWRTRRFRGRRLDVVHGFDCRPVVLGPALSLSKRGVPWVSDWADCWAGEGGAISQRKSWIGRVAFRPLETWLEEGFRKRAAAVTVTSRTLLERAKALGFAPVVHVPSGANVRSVSVRDPAECRAALGLPAEAPIACFVGFVQYDLELVVRAFAAASARVTDAHLVLVGPKSEEARRVAVSLGVSGRVHELGPRPFAEIPKCLGAADVLLLPLRDNLMNRARGPIKLGDYLAAGRAILANPVGDVVDVFAADEIGALAGEAPNEYGEALARLLSDRGLCRRFGERARRVAEEKYAWSRFAPDLENVYRDAIERRKRFE